jgi:hypothetical protein
MEEEVNKLNYYIKLISELIEMPITRTQLLKVHIPDITFYRDSRRVDASFFLI